MNRSCILPLSTAPECPSPELRRLGFGAKLRISVTEQSLICSATIAPQACNGWLLPSTHSKGNVSLAVPSVTRPNSSSVEQFRGRSSRPASSPQQTPDADSDADDTPNADTETDSDANGERSRKNERVVVLTTPDSRTARAVLNVPEYKSPRYVRGSLKYQIELTESFRLDDTARVFEEDEARQHVELGQRARETGEASTTGDEGSVWASETYLRHALKARYNSRTARSSQRYKEVILRYPTTNLIVPTEQPSKDEQVTDPGAVTNETRLQSHSAPNEGLTDEEELYLRSALNAKRQIASEIFEASLRAAQFGPTFTQDLLSCMPQFIDRIVTEAVALKKQSKSKELSFNSRARLYLSNVKLIELIKWLKHQKLTAPRIGRLICTADEYIGLIRSRVQWLRNIYVRGRDLGVIIERYPQVLEMSLEELNERVGIIETAGVERKWLGLVVSRQPRVLTLSADELHGKISMFKELGLSPEQFGIMVFNFPAILGHFSVEEMQSKVDYLRQIGIDDAVLVKILASTPQLLACSIAESWNDLLRFFYFLRIELSGVRRILAVSPSIFCLNLRENIAPKVKFLLAIGVHEEAVGQLIVDFPAILTFSLDKKIRPVARFLLEEAGVTEEKISKVIVMQPELIRCSLEDKLLVLVKYLRSKGFKARQIGEMIEDFPALLMYSVPALHPKFQYLTRAMKRPLLEAVTFPRYFSYSLQSRIVPRYEVLKEKDLNFSLRQMLACSDDVFRTRVAVAEQSDDVLRPSLEAGEQMDDESSARDALAEQADALPSHAQEDPVLVEDQLCPPFCEPNEGKPTDS